MKNKRKGPIIVFIIGFVMLAAGLAFFIYKMASGPTMADADFLVSVGKWAREDTNNVVWDFKEIGKGTLTTDNFANSYDFIWSLDGNRLKTETNWLYDLNNVFEYDLNQNSKTLTLKTPEKATSITFRALED